jgi:hypothetical protein
VLSVYFGGLTFIEVAGVLPGIAKATSAMHHAATTRPR